MGVTCTGHRWASPGSGIRRPWGTPPTLRPRPPLILPAGAAAGSVGNATAAVAARAVQARSPAQPLQPLQWPPSRLSLQRSWRQRPRPSTSRLQLSFPTGGGPLPVSSLPTIEMRAGECPAGALCLVGLNEHLLVGEVRPLSLGLQISHSRPICRPSQMLVVGYGRKRGRILNLRWSEEACMADPTISET